MIGLLTWLQSIVAGTASLSLTVTGMVTTYNGVRTLQVSLLENDELRLKTDDRFLENDGFVLKIAEFSLKNDGFADEMRGG